MAKQILLDVTTFFDEHDFTTDTNTVTLNAEVDDLTATTFGGNGWVEKEPGLKMSDASISGYWQAGSGTVDEFAWGEIGQLSTAFTVTPDGTDGAVSYSFQPIVGNYEALGAVGDLAPFQMSVTGRDTIGIVRGNLLLPKQTVTGNTDGTGVQMGAVAAGQSLYTSIHVFSAGTTADVIVESDDNAGFTSATERSSTTVTAAGGTWVTPVAGAITDDYWRVAVDTVTGSFSLAVAVAIA